MDPSSSNATSYDILFTAINCVSVLVCLLAAILVILFKLLNKLVYRLALYQVLASLAFAMVEVFEINLINYSQSPDVYGQVCTAIGLLSLNCTLDVIAAMLLISQWSMASGITLLLHILVTQRHKYIKNSSHNAYHNSSNCSTVKLESAAGLPVNSDNNFSLPSSSIMGDE